MAEAKGSYVGGTPVYFKDEKARAMLSNEYVPAENYAAGNLCIHEGKLYKATKATTGTWDATAWTETNLAEVNAGMQKSITDLTEKCTISYEEVEFEEKIGEGHTVAGDVRIVISNHDSKILIGAKVEDYDGNISLNCTVSAPVLTPNRSSWYVRIVNLSVAATTVKGKIILTYLG